MRTWIVLLVFVCSPFVAWSQGVDEILSVAGRVAPWLNGKIEVVEIPSVDGMDVFELQTHDGKLVIKANCLPAAGMGLNHYLRYYCKRHFSLTGTNLAPVEVLPEVPVPIRKISSCRYRHTMNFCTQNYSGAFWTWNDWEKAIDFMVLNGVNLTIATTGLEKVWYNTLCRFGFSQEEILAFLPGPAFNAWHMMANMEGWGGSITMETIDMRMRLQQRIVERLRTYGISPIFMSFYGMVPTSLKEKYPDAVIKEQGRWAGGFLRPDILLPGQKLYNDMADVYYEEVKKLYGEFHYFAGEPFHEGGIRDGINISELAVQVLAKMREHNPNCVWVLQGWSGNPSTAFLSRLSKEKDVLIWDMRGELWAEWENRKGYEGYPFLWGVINNFGEKPGLYGRLERFNTEFFRARDSEYGKNLQGLSVAPEGILNNPVNNDLLFDLAWEEKPLDIDRWVEQYSTYRYGKETEAMKGVWSILLRTAYTSDYDLSLVDTTAKELPTIVGNSETLIPAPPALDLKTTSFWGTAVMFYDYKKMRAIAPLLLQATEELAGVDAFEYDLVDFTRQLLSNEFKALYGEVNQAIKENRPEDMVRLSERMMAVMTDMDALLSTRSEFMLGTWIGAARRMGGTSYEKDLYEYNARSIVTFWGPDNITTNLRDYAHKEWAGLIKDVYMPRWQNFFEYQKKRMQGEKVEMENPVALEIAWSKRHDVYPEVPQGDLIETARRILKKLHQGY